MGLAIVRGTFAVARLRYANNRLFLFNFKTQTKLRTFDFGHDSNLQIFLLFFCYFFYYLPKCQGLFVRILRSSRLI